MLLTTKETAKYLKLSIRTIQTYREQGDLPFYQFGRVIRYKQSEIDQFLSKYKNIKPTPNLTHKWVELQDMSGRLRNILHTIIMEYERKDITIPLESITRKMVKRWRGIGTTTWLEFQALLTNQH